VGGGVGRREREGEEEEEGGGGGGKERGRRRRKEEARRGGGGGGGGGGKERRGRSRRRRTTYETYETSGLRSALVTRSGGGLERRGPDELILDQRSRRLCDEARWEASDEELLRLEEQCHAPRLLVAPPPPLTHTRRNLL